MAEKASTFRQTNASRDQAAKSRDFTNSQICVKGLIAGVHFLGVESRHAGPARAGKPVHRFLS
jgi:hypothetical protein